MVLDALPKLFSRRRGLRLVLLGRGDKDLETAIKKLCRKYPGKVASSFAFDEVLAHWIEAGSDLFLMPSRYEPCGLNQMISQRYGTIPVVHATGGLRDTVVPYDGENLMTATGFTIDSPSSKALVATTEKAIRLFRRSKSWRQLMTNAMSRPLGLGSQCPSLLQSLRRGFSDAHAP